MRTILSFCVLILLLKQAPAQAPASLWANLQPGNYKTGFRVIRETGTDGKPFLISLWYPADKAGDKMTIRNYVETGIMNGKEDKQVLAQSFKETLEIPQLFGLEKIPDADYDKLLSTPVMATANAKLTKGKWPLIISDTEPVSLFVTNEWLASQGFIVAVPSADMPPPLNDSLLYKAPTTALEFLLRYMMRQSFIDTANISALGFGGGSQAAFYLSMRTSAIKCLVNVEGGMFMPLSKTTLSHDYNPVGFKIPLLHIVRPQIINGESVSEFNAIASPKKYRLTNLSSTQHHDFTVYGRVVNAVLQKRGNDAALASDIFTQVHELILQFLKLRRLEPSDIRSEQIRLEVF